MPKDWDSGAQAAAGRVREALSEVFGGGGVPSKEVFSFFLFFFKSFKVGGCSREKLGKSKK